jgi:hypothetical protein
MGVGRLSGLCERCGSGEEEAQALSRESENGMLWAAHER